LLFSASFGFLLSGLSEQTFHSSLTLYNTAYHQHRYETHFNCFSVWISEIVLLQINMCRLHVCRFVYMYKCGLYKNHAMGKCLLFSTFFRETISAQAEVKSALAFANLPKATLSFVMSVCLSIRPSVCVSVFPYRTTRLPQDGFSWNLILIIFRNYIENIQSLLKSDKNIRYVTWRSTYIYHNTSLYSSYN
jgi:hypothetical protein